MESTRRIQVSLLLVVGLLLTACGGPGETTGTVASVSTSTSSDAPSEVNGSNPWVLGWVVVGDAGTVFETAETLTVQGGEQPQTSGRTLNESGRFEWLYTTFVEAAEVTVTTDGPVRFEIVVARFADPAAGSMELEVREVIEGVDIDTGGSATISGERP